MGDEKVNLCFSNFKEIVAEGYILLESPNDALVCKPGRKHPRCVSFAMADGICSRVVFMHSDHILSLGLPVVGHPTSGQDK